MECMQLVECVCVCVGGGGGLESVRQSVECMPVVVYVYVGEGGGGQDRISGTVWSACN